MIFTSELFEELSLVSTKSVVKNIHETVRMINDNNICLRKLTSQYKKNNTFAMIKKGTNKPKIEKKEKVLGESCGIKKLNNKNSAKIVLMKYRILCKNESFFIRFFNLMIYLV